MIKIPKETDVTPIIALLAQMYKPHTYVELGTKRGYTFNRVAPLVHRAVAIDCNGFQGLVMFPNVETYKKTTDEMAKKWKDPIDLLFIDACHERSQVLKDFDNFAKFVKIGTGIICMHDTYPIDKDLMAPGYCHDAWKAAWEIRRNKIKYKDFEIVTLPGPFFGISIARRIPHFRHFNEEI